MTVTKLAMFAGIVAGVFINTAVAQELDAANLKAMRAAAASYAAAWLTNDAETVMATFVDEPVLSPSQLPYLEGQDAARAFWFPSDSPPTRVTEFKMDELEASGSGDLGYVRGTFRLAFEYDGGSYENHGKYVTLLRKLADGEWRITHHIWDDFPRDD
jgi:ketosteroid isomerase-like protein